MSSEPIDAVVTRAVADGQALVHVRTAGPAARAAATHVPALVAEKVASRIGAQDPTLWGARAEAEARTRLAWTRLHETSRALLEPLARLRAELVEEGVDRVVLAGMGGSSLAPEVIAGTAGAQLVVLDSTHPEQVYRAVHGDLRRTVLVVSSKSGTTVETDSQRRAFEAAFADAGIDPASRIVVVTDPGSPLQQLAADAGYRAVFEADPNVGGRFSALSAFGLVPAALAGVDVARVLDGAASVADLLTEDSATNPALVLGAAIAGSGRDKLVIADVGSGLYHFGDWVEQLVAESTGKDGTGLLPVVVEADAPELGAPAADVLPILLAPATGGEDEPEESERPPRTEVLVSAPLGGALLTWEHAVAVAGRILGINPFDQPNVESAKAAARALLESTPAPQPPAFEDSGVEVRASAELLDGAQTVSEAVERLLGRLGERGYLAVMAYLDREGRAAGILQDVRAALAARTGRPVTFGWGPRFLHSTGQYHKGGPRTGVFLQITGTPTKELQVPGRDFDFATLIAAQASGDAHVLADSGLPVLRLHVTSTDALAWLAGVLEAAR